MSLYENETLRTQISNKYQYIMVDEYQDTNNLQASLLKLLCATHENLCVVGDDDQSIYSWRGANIENILDFDIQFENTKIVKLEQNYRSTEEILTIAGDDDQSIYSWRGANIENILDFDIQFENTKIVKLEQNYRSTEEILTIANNLIAHNTTRHDKILKATRHNGKKVQYIKSHDDKAEMKQIIESIQTLIAQGESYNDIDKA